MGRRAHDPRPSGNRHNAQYERRHKETHSGGPDWRALRDADLARRYEKRYGRKSDPAEESGKTPAPFDAGLGIPQPPFDLAGWDNRLKSFLNDYQAQAWRLAEQKRATLLLGQAGTSKTHLAVALGLHELVVQQSVQKLVLCRPAVEAGESLGFLPGDGKAKIDPYMMPVYDMLDDMIGTKGNLRKQVNARLNVCPIAYLRGRTFKNSFIVLDEAQNCSWAQLKLVMTRLGRGSRMVVTGDPEQSDLPGRTGQANGNPLARLLHNIRTRALDSGPFLGCYVFPDDAVVRDEAVVEVLKAFAE